MLPTLLTQRPNSQKRKKEKNNIYIYIINTPDPTSIIPRKNTLNDKIKIILLLSCSRGFNLFYCK